MEVTRYLPKTELAAKLHADEVIHGEEAFELQGSVPRYSAKNCRAMGMSNAAEEIEVDSRRRHVEL